MESVVFENRPQYYRALRTSQRDNDATAFIEFGLGAILYAIEQVLVTYSDTDGGVSGEILALLRADPTLNAASLAEHLGKGKRTVERHLVELKASGRLRREGSDKTGRWVVE